MLFIVDAFSKIAGKPVNDNMVSALRGLQFAGTVGGLNKPNRLAMFLGQTALESGGWTWDREIWGPSAAQKRYEGRKDLGNTQPGDGSKFRGYTPMQITGRYNTTKFYNWARVHIDKNCPNFIDNPALMNTDPWEGIGPIWYWLHGKPTSLNVPADNGDYELVTKLINGGYNHLHERYQYYGKASLYLMGMDPKDMRKFQAANGLKADNIVGRTTAKYLHRKLLTLPDVVFNEKEYREPEKVALSFHSFLKSFLNLFGEKNA